MLQSDATTQAASPPPQEASAQEKPWYESLPDDLKSSPAVRKFKGVPDLAQAYVGLEKLMGHPKEKLAVIPDDEAERQALAARLLGVPEPEKYDIPVDGLDETIVKSPVFEWFKNAAKELRLPPAAARKLAEGWAVLAKQAQDQQDAARAEAVEKAIAELKLEWGPQFDRRVADARAALGAVERLLQASGYKGEPLVDVLSEAGLDSHPGIVKMFAELRRFFREDAVAGTAGLTGAPQNSSVVEQIERLTDEAIKAANDGDRERAYRLSHEAAKLRALLANGG